MKPLTLALQPVQDVIIAGTVPAFRLTVRNDGTEPQPVLRLRGDLQDTYYDLEVTRGGERLEVPRSISDPGPVGAEDFLTLMPGEQVTFDLARFAAVLESLPPGKYEARVRFWQNPYQSADTAYLSSVAVFTVQT